ncbi:MAG: PfkB family carbohydrate kinase, partial [Pseudomonadota bacterium]
AGIDVSGLLTVNAATGHAMILVDRAGENVIVIHAGANRALTDQQIDDAIGGASKGDWLLLQNETNLVPEAARAARKAGLKVAYAAAPFDAATASEMLGHVDLLVVNEVEAAQLSDHLAQPLDSIDVPGLLITKGAEGAMYLTADGTVAVEAFDVTPVDTTGAGDTFLGVFLAGLDADTPPQSALTLAAAAAALQVTRPGAADAIPTSAEIQQFLDAGAEARKG